MTPTEAFLRLSESVPPPDEPVRAWGDWKRFTSVNGFPPPEDYRMVIREYGAGSFGGWLHLIEPFNPGWSFIEKVREALRAFAGPGAGSVWPDPGGFLPWATAGGGDLVGWRTDGRPDGWRVRLLTRTGSGSADFDEGAATFLLGLARNTHGLLGGQTAAVPFFTPAHL